MDNDHGLTTPKNREIELAQTQLLQLEYIEKQFYLMERKAKLLAASSFVPDEFKNNVPNCMICIEMAERLKSDPALIARQIYFVHNRPSFSAKFLIALLNASGLLVGRLKFDMQGEPGKDTRGCIAYGIEKKTGEEIRGPLVTVELAKKEGWYTKNGSKWPNMPELMLQYRAASFFVSVNFPGLLSGMETTEDIQDAIERDISGEVIRANKTARQPEQAALPARETIDTETGEIITHETQSETTKENPQQTEIEKKPEPENKHSPAYNALMEKLLKTETADQVNELRRNPLFKKCNSIEKDDFDRKAKSRYDAIKAGMNETLI